MADDDPHTSARRAAFAAEVKRSTRTTAVTAGVIAIVAFPAWAIFDRLVDPSHSAEFTAIRLALEIPLIALWLSLFTRWGRRHPEPVMLLVVGVIQIAIAYMTARTDHAYAAYVAGVLRPARARAGAGAQQRPARAAGAAQPRGLADRPRQPALLGRAARRRVRALAAPGHRPGSAALRRTGGKRGS